MVESLKPRAPFARWIPEQNLHVTMRFLGAVEPTRIDAIAAAAADAARESVRGGVSLDAPGCFPSARRPRVVWIGLRDPASVLATLAAGVERALGPLGFAAEARRFRPHVTVARVPRPEPIDLGGVTVEPLEVPVEDLTLFESHLGKGPARYDPLARLPLGRA